VAAPAPTLTLRQLNRATLARQLLLARDGGGARDAVERLVGLQAQVARPPFIGLWTRLERCERAELNRLLTGKQLVRVTAMRATLHLMSARDFLRLRATLQPALTAAMKSALGARADRMDLDEALAIARAAFGERPQTFDDLRKRFEADHAKDHARAMAYAVRTHLPLVQLPADAPWGFPSSADYAVAESWLKKPLAQEIDTGELLRRYLAAFGPATIADARTWSGLRGLAEPFAALRPRLRVFRDERGRELFDLPDAPRPPEDTPAPVRFLPDFDNLVLSHDDRARVIEREHRARIVIKNLIVRATFLVDGVVAGAWSIARAKNIAKLELEPFVPLAKRVKAELTDEGERLLRFCEEDAIDLQVSFKG
jgi:hypothetical protein